MSRAIALALLAGALAGCDRGPTLLHDASLARSERLALAAAQPADREESRVIAEFHLPEAGLPDWETDARRAEIRRYPPRKPDALRVLELAGEERMHVILRGPFDASTFNQVAVTVRMRRPEAVFVQLGRPDEDGPLAPSQLAKARPSPVTILFDLPGLEWQPRTFDDLTIGFPNHDGEVGLVSVALIRRPLSLWLASPEEGSELAQVGDQWRRAVGLSTTCPLAASFEARSQARLAFSHGVTSASAGPGRAHRLRLLLRDERGTERSLAFRPREQWRSESVPLEPFAGRIQARFEVRLEGGGEGLLALGEPTVELRAHGAPTVLLISSDTHRADHLGVSPAGVDVRTPVLDELARRGVLFENCVATANVTHPSHVALMTGFPPRDTGVVQNTDLLGDAAVTLAERFREAGWVTYGAVGVGSFQHNRSGLGQGFDRLSAPITGYRECQPAVDLLLDWLEDAEGLPLFVWLHVFDAHTPYRVRPQYSRHYYPGDRDPRDPSLPEVEPWILRTGQDDVRDLDYLVALYRAEVSYLDAQLGRLLGQARLEEGICAFTADHGESLTAHGVYFGHEQLYPQTLCVPLILAWPGGPRGELVSRPVRQVDVGRTLLELAGLDPGDFPGEGLIAPDRPMDLRFSLAASAVSASVFAGRWFLVLHLRRHHPPDPDAEPIAAHTVELYDLREDPECLVDLADERPEETRRLRQQVIDWLLAARPMGWNVTSAVADMEALEQLAALGYASGSRESSSNDWFDPDCDCEHCARYR